MLYAYVNNINNTFEYVCVILFAFFPFLIANEYTSAVQYDLKAYVCVYDVIMFPENE